MAAPAVNRPMTALEWGLLLVLSVLWGGSFFFVGIAVRELPPFTIVFLRVALAACLLHVVVRLMAAAMPRRRQAWTAFFGMALLNNVVPFLLIVWGQRHIASGLASILNATTPLFTVLVAHRFTADETLTGERLVGAIVGFAGVIVMIGSTALETAGVDLLAQIAVLAAALSYAFAGVFGRRFRTMGVAPIATATGQLTASSLILLPLMLIADSPWALPWPSAETIAALVGLAVLSTAMAYILFFRILATAGATNLLLVTFLIPVSAVLLGVLVLGEALEARQLVGMALIGLGLAAVDGRPWRYLKRRLRLPA